MMSDLESRLRVLEDIEAIRRLKATHYRAVDTQNRELLLSIFTDDIVWESGIFGRLEGLQEMREMVDAMPIRLKFSVHYITNGAIDVHGDSARGTWYGLVACTMAATGQAAWGSTVVEEEYARLADGWKIKRFLQQPQFWTPFDKGWVEERFVGTVHGWAEQR